MLIVQIVKLLCICVRVGLLTYVDSTVIAGLERRVVCSGKLSFLIGFRPSGMWKGTRSHGRNAFCNIGDLRMSVTS
jgi:hypothetical protein